MVKYQNGNGILSRIPHIQLSKYITGPAPVQEIKGETIHPYLKGAIFRLWQVPGEEQVWVNQNHECRPEHQGVGNLTGFLAPNVVLVGAYLALQGEFIKQGEAEIKVVSA